MSAVTLDADYCRSLLPTRDPDGHKYTFGRVVCVAGSHDYLGAALLTVTGAARGGAGVVTLAVPHWMWPVVAGRVPEVVTLALWGDENGVDLEADRAFDDIAAKKPNALVVGPGLLQTDGYRSLLLTLLRTPGEPMVIDGGGLTLLASSPDWAVSIRRPCVLTPHAGEFARLTGAEVPRVDDARLSRALKAAKDYGQTVVLKGPRTVVAAADGRAAVAPFANAALATAGSGDVLAGLIGALLAQGVHPFDAACLGVYLHGRAGERLSMRLGNAGVLASDIAQELPATRHELDAHSA